jgi:hypothetical protein
MTHSESAQSQASDRLERDPELGVRPASFLEKTVEQSNMSPYKAKGKLQIEGVR